MTSVNEQYRRRGSETSRDVRVKRTRRALHDALGSLLHERPFESIGIKQILGRAEVARATFYAHFDGKEDLLASAVSDLMEGDAGTKPVADPVLSFSLPLLEHIGKLRSNARPNALQLGFHRGAHSKLHEVVSEFVSRELAKRPTRGELAAPLVAEQVARTFTVVLEWWLMDAPETPVPQVQEIFARLVAPALR